MRGCDINNCCRESGLTPLHWAIEKKLPSNIIKFLIKLGANPHIEDHNGKDACDKAKNAERYHRLKDLTDKNEGCSKDPSLRIKFKT